MVKIDKSTQKPRSLEEENAYLKERLDFQSEAFALIHKQLQAANEENADLNIQIEAKDALIRYYEQQFILAQNKKYGPKSEKTQVNPRQLSLFDEAELLAEPDAKEPEIEEIAPEAKLEEDIKKPRKKHTSKVETFEKMVTKTVVHDLPEEEKVCSCCNNKLKEFKVERNYSLEIIPARVEIIKHQTPLYVCNKCDGHDFKTTFAKDNGYVALLPKSSASASSVAWLAEQKFSLGLPTYRAESQFKELGISLSRQTMSNWLLKTAEIYIQPLYAHMHKHLLTKNHLHADETGLQVIKEPGRNAAQKSYMWLYATGRGDPPIVLYDYQMTKGATHPQKFLKGFKGALQVDGYAGYNHLGEDVKLAGCWAHCRRKFTDLVASLPKDVDLKDTVTQKALALIAKLYKTEKKLKDILGTGPYDQAALQKILQERQSSSKQQCDEFFKLCKDNRDSSTGLLIKALDYSLKEEAKLRTFLDNPLCEIDNNRAERSIKPFVLGRKAWMFAATPRGASGSAAFYSLVVTAKANKLRVHEYLTYVLETMSISRARSEDFDLEPLMPWSDQLPDHVKLIP